MNKEIKCPFCNKEFTSEYDIIYHIKKKHGWRKIREVIRERRKEKVNCQKNQVPAKSSPTKSYKQCPYCNNKLLEKNFLKHMANVHNERIQEVQKPLTKRQHLNKILYPDGPLKKSDDFLDSPNVVSGGGFGVGKGKK